jgi:hypothetical protein
MFGFHKVVGFAVRHSGTIDADTIKTCRRLGLEDFPTISRRKSALITEECYESE